MFSKLLDSSPFSFEGVFDSYVKTIITKAIGYNV